MRLEACFWISYVRLIPCAPCLFLMCISGLRLGLGAVAGVYGVMEVIPAIKIRRGPLDNRSLCCCMSDPVCLRLCSTGSMLQTGSVNILERLSFYSVTRRISANR
ncbi:hypothetical protein GE09DRAFT_111742 [Coniochaeta sp. 2T2.1]|nr:hypothetical protein GE09DRAFT_111742 [Coniochaeta sp. 2T2.1]